MDPIAKYLKAYAEPEALGYVEQLGASAVDRVFQRVLVVPMYDEPLDCLVEMTHSLALSEETLVIAVVNMPSDALKDKARRTQALLASLKTPNGGTLLVVDRVSHPLPRHQGVGLARKLGTDIALVLYAKRRLLSPWFYQTDADATLPENYFAYTPESPGACVFAHRHVHSDPKLQTAALMYEAHMQHYLKGLQSAGSGYNFPTLGSTICVHAEAYAVVRGYPRRNAGEDFYLLNKIAKTHGVAYEPRITIQLAARRSTRVPFGTGPALQRILDQDLECLTYHPNSFALLRRAILELNEFANTNRAITDPQVSELLTAIGWDRVATTLGSKYPTGERRQRAVHEWFDALKTLRFIHEARRYFPDQPLTAVSSLT